MRRQGRLPHGCLQADHSARCPCLLRCPMAHLPLCTRLQDAAYYESLRADREKAEAAERQRREEEQAAAAAAAAAQAEERRQREEAERCVAVWRTLVDLLRLVVVVRWWWEQRGGRGSWGAVHLRSRGSGRGWNSALETKMRAGLLGFCCQHAVGRMLASAAWLAACRVARPLCSCAHCAKSSLERQLHGKQAAAAHRPALPSPANDATYSAAHHLVVHCVFAGWSGSCAASRPRCLPSRPQMMQRQST